MQAMISFRDPAAVTAAMQSVLSGKVALADGFLLLLVPGQASPNTQKMAFEFLKAHFDEIMKNHPSIFGNDLGSFESEWLLWLGPLGWRYVRKTGPILSWREGSSFTARTRPSAKTCSRSQGQPHHPGKWSWRGQPRPKTTITTRTNAMVYAGTTRK